MIEFLGLIGFAMMTGGAAMFLTWHWFIKPEQDRRKKDPTTFR